MTPARLREDLAREQVPVPVLYKGAQLDCGFRVDVLVEDTLLVELKAVDKLRPVHVSQVVTYLKLAKVEVGLLVNFNVPRLVDGIRRLTGRKTIVSPSLPLPVQ